MVLGNYIYLTSVSKNAIVAILKAIQVSKAACVDNLS